MYFPYVYRHQELNFGPFTYNYKFVSVKSNDLRMQVEALQQDTADLPAV